MDYMGLGAWAGELVLRPFDPNAIRHALDGPRIWARGIPEAYPGDFIVQMESLAKRFADRPGLLLEVVALAHGGTAQITCEPAST
jgi:hypothetical protein